MSFVDQEGGLSGSAFKSVYLFNIATNEIQRPHNKSLDASGGSVFLMMIGPAMLE
jgi:hypothetical protein